MRFLTGLTLGVALTIHLHHARWWQHALWWTFTTDQRPKMRTTRRRESGTGPSQTGGPFPDRSTP